MQIKLLRIFYGRYLTHLYLILLFNFAIDQIYAQTVPQASATGNIFAEVISAYTATETSQLNFGRFSPGPEGGEIVLTPENSISTLGNIYIAPGVKNAGSFYITGDKDASFTINLPAEPVILKHSSSAKSMIVKDWNTIPEQGIGTGTLKNGFQTVYVGATLQVGSLDDNPTGVYAGTYIITIDFN